MRSQQSAPNNRDVALVEPFDAFGVQPGSVGHRLQVALLGFLRPEPGVDEERVARADLHAGELRGALEVGDGDVVGGVVNRTPRAATTSSRRRG
jgi:hypothetical protein